MAHYRLTKWLFMFSLFAGSFVQGQAIEHYNSTGTYDVIDNSTNCQTHNCFLAAGSSMSRIAQISTGVLDDTVLGIGNYSNGVGNVYSLPLSTPSTKADWYFWSANPQNVHAVAVRSANEVYVLSPTSACNGYGYGISRYDGSAFHATNGCLTQPSITGDDVLLGVNSPGGLFYTKNPQAASPTWIQIPNGTFWYVAGLNSSTAYAIGGNTLYKVNLTNNTYAAMSGAPAVKGITVAFPYLFIVTTGNAVERIDLTQANPAWVTVQGSMSAIYGSSSDTVFGIDSNSEPFHLLNYALRGTVASSGYTDCGTNGCPTGSEHTITSTAGFPGGYFYNNSAKNSGAPTATIAASTYDVAGACDIFFGDLSSGNCALSLGQGEVQCTVMGEIFYETVTNGSSPISHKTAHTRSQWLTPDPPVEKGTGLWEYKVGPYCSNTSAPLFNPNFVYAQHEGDVEFDEHGECFSFFGGPYHCIYPYLNYGAVADNEYVEDQGTAFCDK